ncbi:hypothetical protein [Kineococcus rhizosphaerae]|uniref:hypothetical protein n=1 Tax=Kineococcus rhizosphaerae TaxID=559628 RepID=UPI0011B29391|nr:hypothetical protein [Kineococcus rhizosphaerae]
MAVLFGEWGRALVGVGAVLGGAVGSLYRAEDTDPPVVARFGTPPDAATQEAVHRAVTAGRLPDEPALAPVAVEYAAGWVRQSRRALAAVGGGALAWCTLTAALTVWFVHRWPDSATTRTSALVVSVAGAVAWALLVVVPGRGRRRRLRALAGQR